MNKNIKDYFVDSFKTYLSNNEDFQFEIREQQITFLTKWFETINKDDIVLIDAPTGIGKTFGYIIPIIAKIKENIINSTGKVYKAIIATSTINLQEQIFFKDIPLIKAVFGDFFTVKLLKGRNNYLCTRKLFTFFNEIRSEDMFLYKTLTQFAATTKTGEYQEIENKIPLTTWIKIESHSSTCLNKLCPHYNDCYYFKARVEAEYANILILNHHLLITDLSMKDYPFLDKMDSVVIDEAHNFIPTIESITTKSFSFFDTNHYLKEFELFLNNKLFLDFFKKEKAMKETIELLKELIITLKQKTTSFFVEVSLFLEKTKYINLNNKAIKDMDKLFAVIKSYSTDFNDFYNYFAIFMTKVTDFETNLTDKRELVFKPLSMQIDVMNEFFSVINEVISENIIKKFETMEVVKWIDLKESRNIIINSLDLNNSTNIAKLLISDSKSYLLTSATLAIANNFEHIKKNLFLKECEELLLSSPFDLRKQVEFYVADIAYNYNDENYYKKINDILLKILKDGHALVLFSSYRDMNLVYKLFKDKFNNSEINLYIQGESFSRTQLVENFKKEKNSILFGTKSFFEGIDIKGYKLSNVVIVKLPFKSIDDPIMFNKDFLLKKQNKNSFSEIMLPDMILTLKQGIGRLIRSKEDKGKIFILDNRFKTATYSKTIQKSFSDYDIKDL